MRRRFAAERGGRARICHADALGSASSIIAPALRSTEPNGGGIGLTIKPPMLGPNCPRQSNPPDIRAEMSTARDRPHNEAPPSGRPHKSQRNYIIGHVSNSQGPEPELDARHGAGSAGALSQ